MIENSYYSRSALKARILESNLLEYICAICNILPEWNGKELMLVLDHINGVNNDHRLENLRFVCPNCDSQSLTYCGRNNRGGKKANLCLDCSTEITHYAERCRSCAAKHNTRHKIDWPDPQKLLELLEELNGNYSALGRKLGVSDNSIRKHILNYCDGITG